MCNFVCYLGIYGLKFIFGFVFYIGVGLMILMIDYIGLLVSNLEDIVILLEVMVGYDGFDGCMSFEILFCG